MRPRIPGKQLFTLCRSACFLPKPNLLLVEQLDLVRVQMGESHRFSVLRYENTARINDLAVLLYRDILGVIIDLSYGESPSRRLRVHWMVLTIPCHYIVVYERASIRVRACAYLLPFVTHRLKGEGHFLNSFARRERRFCNIQFPRTGEWLLGRDQRRGRYT